MPARPRYRIEYNAATGRWDITRDGVWWAVADTRKQAAERVRGFRYLDRYLDRVDGYRTGRTGS